MEGLKRYVIVILVTVMVFGVTHTAERICDRANAP